MADQPTWGSDEWQAQTLTGPAADAARARLGMDPDERKLDLEARKSEAQARHVAEARALTEAMTEQRKVEERIEEKQIEKERVKQRRADQPIATADPKSIKLKVVRFTDMTEKDEKPYFLLEPYLIADSVVGFYGKGGSGKSSLIATFAAVISSFASTLWISTEETESNILNRYLKPITNNDNGAVAYSSWGHDATLHVFQTVVTKVDKDGRAIESLFNVYEHLEPAIIMAQHNVLNVNAPKPLKLVVLDTIVALTTWDKQAGANSDEGVKKLMAYLRGLAEKHKVTIAVVGHANKGKHEHFADGVMGAAAWTTSPRLSFIHGKDRTTEGQIIVRLAKGNEVPEFAQLFRLHMVHELAQIADGPKAGMSKVEPLARVWGSMDAEELWEEVTTKPKADEDDGGFTDKRKRKRTVADIVRDKLVEMAHSGTDPHITREQVECQLPDVKVNRAQWGDVDMELRLMELVYKVEVTTLQRTIIYRAIPDQPPK